MLQSSIEILHDIKTNQVTNFMDITSYLSPKKKSRKTEIVDNYWINRYETPCPYLEHKLINPIKKPNKKLISSCKKKTKKALPLYLPYHTRRIDPEHFGRLLIKSNNDIARIKLKQVTENTPGIQRWPEIKQKNENFDLVGKRQLSAARTLSPLKPQTSRPNSGIGGLSSIRLNRDTLKSYDYVNDTYQKILYDDDIMQNEENAVAELRAALLHILNGNNNVDEDNANDYDYENYCNDHVSPVLFESINHIIALKNFEPNSNNTVIINNDNNSDISEINYHHYSLNKNITKPYIENDSMYIIDSPSCIKDIINSDSPSIVNFSLTHNSIDEEPVIKPSRYTSKLRSIVSNTKVDDSNDDTNVYNNDNNNDNSNYDDDSNSLVRSQSSNNNGDASNRVRARTSSDLAEFLSDFDNRRGRSFDANVSSFDYLYNTTNLDDIDAIMNSNNEDKYYDHSLLPELKNLLDLDQSSMVIIISITTI